MMTPTPTPAFTYRAIIDRWVDGDTVVVAIDLGFSIWSHQIVRLLHINAPEMATPEGPRSLDAMKRQAPAGSPCMIQTHLDRLDNWHRVLADIWVAKHPDETLNEWALGKGWAVPWPAKKGVVE